jgi:hypothetical protein
MNVFCVATGITGYERVTPDDLARIRSTKDATELKELLRQWCWTTIDPGEGTTHENA